MRKTDFAVLLLGAILAGPVFAGEYAVERVTGKVEREVSPGKWQTIVKGMVLDSAAVIDTGPQSQLVLNADGRFLIIGARQRGPLENLIEDAPASGIRIGEKAAESKAGIGSGETPAAQDTPAAPR
jgi:hypothetical protein